ncbi:MAG TPA: response regulator [Kofleriaceae bacterium]|nr:response regulator [Kofleriaceae bacterium]
MVRPGAITPAGPLTTSRADWFSPDATVVDAGGDRSIERVLRRQRRLACRKDEAMDDITHPALPEEASEFFLSEQDIDRRHVFVNLQPVDLTHIAAISNVVVDHADQLTATFFEFLARMGEAKPLLANRALAERARTLKRDHLIAMVGGTYGVPYAMQRVELGLLYSRAPLDPRVFLGAFHHLLKSAGEMVMKGAVDPLERFGCFMSLEKVAFFDIGIIVDVLVFERERIIRAQQLAIRELSLQKARVRAELLEQQSRLSEEASRLKSEFLANMSHELRTPLNSIIGFADLLHDGDVGPVAVKQKEFLQDILTSSKHLLHLINDVLDLSKVESGTVEFVPESIDLAQVVTEVLSVLRTKVASKRIRVETSIEREVGQVVLDVSRLKQVLYNYLSNALKFTPEGGTVSIRALPAGDTHVRIEVADTGIGIAAGDMQRLFIEFQQLDAGSAKTHQGTGLGLALTRRLVEAQGGTVGVNSALGEGSTFHAILPRHFVGAGPRPARPVIVPRAGARTVLVVEDDPRDQELIVATLVGAGYAVEAVSTGSQAIARCLERAFDAVTLDLLLPDMSGLQVLEVIRSRGQNADVPVVVITVVTDSAVSGYVVQDILAKPIAPAALLAALRRAGVVSSVQSTVAVIEDDPGSSKLMATTLEQLGYRPRCYANGRSALAALETMRPVAVILDLMMPEMDGFTFIREFRALPEAAQTPVFVWTVKDLSPLDRARLRGQVQALIPKGQTGGDALLKTLRHHLGARQPDASGSHGDER